MGLRFLLWALALKVKREGKLGVFVFKKTPNKKKERKQKKSKKEIPKDFHMKQKENKKQENKGKLPSQVKLILSTQHKYKIAD